MEMARAIISNPQGQLLINSLDINNDSPIQLAAYRNKNDIYMMLANNNAFLDQPNAGGEDAIDAIQNPEEKKKMIDQMTKIQTLSEGNKKRIQAELNKKNQTTGSSIPGGEDKKDQKTESSMKQGQQNSNEHPGSHMTEKRDGNKVYEKVMRNQQEYIYGTSNLEASNSPTKSQTSRPIMTTSISVDDDFELSQVLDEYLPTDEINVVSIMPSAGFFFIAKSTAYDQITN